MLQVVEWVAPPWQVLKALPLTHNRYTKTKNNDLNEEQIKAPEKIQLSNEETANQSDPQFKTLVIRMHSEMVEYGCKIEEKMKAMKSEIKENIQRNNNEG